MADRLTFMRSNHHTMYSRSPLFRIALFLFALFLGAALFTACKHEPPVQPDATNNGGGGDDDDDDDDDDGD